jgi:D-alanyl-lipoteichoic acid acyltransferase DltB (MBOAT superfamily)
MLFFSPLFLFAFLPIVWIVFRAIGGKVPSWVSIIWLLLSSWVFYAWAYPVHLLWLIGSISTNFLCSIAIQRHSGTPKAKQLLVAGIAINLLLLGGFKYSGFATESFATVFGLSLQPPSFLLPLAISFFTFQQISYLVTTYREQRLIARPLEYALYVSFFPQLIAGPIVQPGEMIPQLQSKTFGKTNRNDIALGLCLFTIGLGKKILLADNLAPIADAAFGQIAQGNPLSALAAWMGLLAFTLQIYFDFSAYSEMALGLGRLFGIRLPENFASPYRAFSIIDFWRRWHITLSSFFKNFLYIPLGGNQKGFFRKHSNILLTMTIAGLWHGANWTFLIWGFAHGLFLSINHFWRFSRIKLPFAASWLLTFIPVTLCWTFFRAENLTDALHYFSALAGKHGWSSTDGLSFIEYLQTLLQMDIWKPVHFAIHFLGWYPGLINGIHIGQFLFSETVLTFIQITTAMLIVLLFPRPLAWISNPINGEARFSKKAALLCSAIIVIIIVQSGTFQTAPFIYFRF